MQRRNAESNRLLHLKAHSEHFSTTSLLWPASQNTLQEFRNYLGRFGQLCVPFFL